VFKFLRKVKDYLALKHSGLFDEEYYCLQYPDVRQADANPLWHFVSVGWKEGRNPSNKFNTNYYLENYPDVKLSEQNPLKHFLLFGHRENRLTTLADDEQLSFEAKKVLVDEKPDPKPLISDNSSKTTLTNNLKDSITLISTDQTSKNLNLENPIDIIIPVYNGFQFLPALFESIIENTRTPYRLIIVDDKSTDLRVVEMLNTIKEELPQTILITHENNQGFVASINEAALYTNDHFVILNTDTEVPRDWLSRLTSYLYKFDDIASVTPMTNAGTICSFPAPGQDNELYLGHDVNFIDEVFEQVDTTNIIELPTGVGFCMAINRKVWERIGPFNVEVFGQGYGEENDWCRKAVENGYRNILAPNLFIFHKHGGSFLPEEKKELSQTNLQKVVKLHPDYLFSVAEFSAKDPIKPIRNIVELLLMIKDKPEYSILIVDHELGGGAFYYREKLVQKRLLLGHLVFIFTYNFKANIYRLQVNYKNYSTEFLLDDFSDLEILRERLQIDKVIVNNFVSYPDPLAFVSKFKNYVNIIGADLEILLHDYYLLCPSVNLLNQNGEFCDLPEETVCNQCLTTNEYVSFNGTKDIEIWREYMGSLLNRANRVVVFSNSSLKLLLKTYELDRRVIEVVPHVMEISFPHLPKVDFDNPLTIGIVGVLTYSKGNSIISQIADELKQLMPNARIVIIGESQPEINIDNVILTGKYNVEELPKILEFYKVNMCLFSSIWPETFSYVTSELMLLQMPIACFNLGAQAEKIQNYSLGKVLSKIEPNTAANELIDFYISLKNQKHIDEHIVSNVDKSDHEKTTEEIKAISLFSTHGFDPCAHLRVRGPMEANQIKVIEGGLDFANFESVVDRSDLVIIQRSYPKHYRQYTKICELARNSKTPLVFEIDDYLFNLGPSHPETRRSTYSDALFLILEAVEQSDLVTVSTEPLKIRLQTYNKNIRVLPNFLDDNYWEVKEPKCQTDQSGVLSIGYMGGFTHASDLAPVIPVLQQILDKYGEHIELRFFGIKPPSPLRFLKQVKWIRSQYYKYIEFSKWFQNQTADIFIAPLDNTEFNQYKSAIKYLEYSALGVPGIYSDLEPYRNVIRNGENGLLAKAPEDFFDLLEELMQNKSLRLSVAQKAVQDIKTNWLLSKNKDMWVKAYLNAKTLVKTNIDQDSVIKESNTQMFMRVKE
jgi:GT2 family glycosyltransferase